MENNNDVVQISNSSNSQSYTCKNDGNSNSDDRWCWF